MVAKMSDAGRQAMSAVSKAAPTASKVAGIAARALGGPAATAAAAVMTPTPAGAGENEKQRQDTLKSYNPYKAQGRSVSDYEKQVMTPKASEAPKVSNPKVDAPTPPSRPDYFSRGQAFQAARGEAGGGEGKFSYDNKSYQTNVSGEKYKPAAQLKPTSVQEAGSQDKDWDETQTPFREQVSLNKQDIKLQQASYSGAGGTQRTVHEETKMDNKLINEAIENIMEDNLSAMKENLMVALQEKAIEKLEERKKDIASQYFAQ
jgi:hypothetical protein